jgi:hypothetical protein
MADMVVEPGPPQDRWAEHAPPPITAAEQYAARVGGASDAEPPPIVPARRGG